MKETENIPVFIKYKDGKTICICHAGNKLCSNECYRDTVSRDKFAGWKQTMIRDKYGK